MNLVFVQLHMYPKGHRPGSSYSLSSSRGQAGDGRPFLQWKIGDMVAKKGSDEDWKIVSIDGRSDTNMTYQATVQLVSEDGEEKKELRGSTLQTGYAFVKSAEEAKIDPKFAGTKLATFNVMAFRDFYPRKNNQPGTRIIMTNGTAYIVADAYDDIRGMLREAEVKMVGTDLGSAPLPAGVPADTISG